MNSALPSLKLPARIRAIRVPGKAPLTIPEEELFSSALPTASTPLLPAPEQRDTSLKDLLEQILLEIELLEERRVQSLTELQQVAIELGIAAASAIIGTAARRGCDELPQRIRQLIQELLPDAHTLLKLHPEDVTRVQAELNEAPTEMRNLPQIRGDHSLPRGSFRLETPHGRIFFSDVSEQLCRIRQGWLEGLQDAQIERRTTPAATEGLHRYPDRRSTA